jgi:hypothetical protein
MKAASGAGRTAWSAVAQKLNNSTLADLKSVILAHSGRKSARLTLIRAIPIV